MSNSNVRGRFIWHELMTSDTKAAGAFYRKVIGWKTEGWPQDPSYQMFAAKSGPVAGYMLLPEEAKAMGAPPNWMTYIGTPDVDDTASHAERLGGKVLKAPEDIPNVGRFAVLQDPQGAVFAIFTPGMEGTPRDTPAVGEFSWHELITTDPEAGFEFYAALFGWEKTEAMNMGAEGTYQMFGFGGKSMGGIYRKPAAMPAPPNWLPYVLVADWKKAAGTLRVLGGGVLMGPMEVPGGDWIVVCTDLQGAVFAIHGRAAAKPAAAKKAVKKAAPKKKVAKKAARKKAAKKAARKPARKGAARKPAKKAARRKAPSARKPTKRSRPKKRK